MTDIVKGMTPAQHIAALNSNFTELFGVGNFTVITATMVGQDLIDAINDNYGYDYIAIGNKGTQVISTTNQAFGPQTYYVKNDGDDSKSGLSETDAWSYHPWMADYSGKTILKAGDNICMKSGDSWIKSNPTVPVMVVGQSGSAGKFITTKSFGTGNKPLIKIDTETAKNVITADNKAFIKFNDLHIQHHSSVYGENMFGVFLSNVCHDFTFTNNEIDDIPHTCILSYTNSYNIIVGDENATTRATTTDHSNHLHDFGDGGVVLMGSNPATLESNFHVKRNYIHGSTKTGEGENCYGIAITAGSTSASWPKYAYVDHNIVEDIKTWEAIETHGGSYLYFRNNYVKDFCRGIHLFNTLSTDLTPELHHIWVEDNEVEQPVNTLPNTAFHSFIAVIPQWFNRADHITIKNNKCRYTERPEVGYLYGIYCKNTDVGEISGNEISNGQSVSGPIAIYEDIYSVDLVIENNTVTDWVEA